METLGSGRRRGSPCRCPRRDRSALTLSPQFTPQDQPHAASPCASRPGYPARDSRTWTRVASSPQAKPPTPRRSHLCLRVCGVGGLWQDPHHEVDQGHCCGMAAGRWPKTDLAQSGRVYSAVTTSTAPEGPGCVRGLRAGLCTLHHLGLGVARKCRSEPGRRLLLWSCSPFTSKPPPFLFPSTRWRLRSRLLSAVPKLVREGEEGQYKAKGPAPLTRHRDKSDLFILVKKSNKDNFALHLA